MACGVTKTLQGQTVTCDNAGASNHAGLHSGMLSYSVTNLFGISIQWPSSTRVFWSDLAQVFAKQKTAVVGESDFV